MGGAYNCLTSHISARKMTNSRRLPRENCLACDKELKELARKYCDHKCANDAIYREFIAKWKAGLVDGGNGRYGEVSNHVRRYLAEKYGNCCVECGWSKRHPHTGNVPVNVEHIDGDSGNNREENL